MPASHGLYFYFWASKITWQRIPPPSAHGVGRGRWYGSDMTCQDELEPTKLRWQTRVSTRKCVSTESLSVSADISCCNVPLVSFQINFLIINRESNKAWSREIKQKEKDKKKKPKWNSTVELPIKTQTIQYKRPQTIHRYSQVLPQLHLMPPLDWPFHKGKKRSDNKHT